MKRQNTRGSGGRKPQKEPTTYFLKPVLGRTSRKARPDFGTVTEEIFSQFVRA